MISLPASAKFPGQKFLSKNESSGADIEPKTCVLNSGDELFSELRDKNFSAVGLVVNKKAKLISAEFDVSFGFKNLVTFYLSL